MSYASLDLAQRAIARRVLEEGPGALIFAELDPVITYGRRTLESDIQLSEPRLRSMGVELYPTDRGGYATWHGPGQWVVFAVDRLERLTGDRRGVRKAVRSLLEIAQEAALPVQPQAEIRWDAETGVWTPQGKLASVGIHISGGVVLHGVALNVYPTPASFVGLRPCGLDTALSYLYSGPSEAPESVFLEVRERLQAAVFKRFWS